MNFSQSFLFSIAPPYVHFVRSLVVHLESSFASSFYHCMSSTLIFHMHSYSNCSTFSALPLNNVLLVSEPESSLIFRSSNIRKPFGSLHSRKYSHVNYIIFCVCFWLSKQTIQRKTQRLFHHSNVLDQFQSL